MAAVLEGDAGHACGAKLRDNEAFGGVELAGAKHGDAVGLLRGSEVHGKGLSSGPAAKRKALLSSSGRSPFRFRASPLAVVVSRVAHWAGSRLMRRLEV